MIWNSPIKLAQQNLFLIILNNPTNSSPFFLQTLLNIIITTHFLRIPSKSSKYCHIFKPFVDLSTHKKKKTKFKHRNKKRRENIYFFFWYFKPYQIAFRMYVVHVEIKKTKKSLSSSYSVTTKFSVYIHKKKFCNKKIFSARKKSIQVEWFLLRCGVTFHFVRTCIWGCNDVMWRFCIKLKQCYK